MESVGSLPFSQLSSTHSEPDVARPTPNTIPLKSASVTFYQLRLGLKDALLFLICRIYGKKSNPEMSRKKNFFTREQGYIFYPIRFSPLRQ
jgi:hypothetical protein